jgi:phytoene synthase
MQTRWQPSHDERADLAACREKLSNGSRTFLAASLLLPRAVREPACALYAFCREADDAVDQQGAAAGAAGAARAVSAASVPAAASAVSAVRARLAALYDGYPQDRSADRALAFVVRRYAIPRALPLALLEGFEWDATGRRYETIDDLHDYAARVAGTVGAMMALLMGVRSATGLARACDLGVAMQLSNIARDVGEDARMGRLYLPRQWLREAGIEDADAWLAEPRFNAGIATVVARLLAAADVLYRRVDAGVAMLPLACRPGINAARCLYAEIGHEVQRRGLNSIDQRAVVGRARKAASLATALATCFVSPASAAAPPLPATQFLVDAVLQSPPPRAGIERDAASWSPTRRLVQMIDLFERLERRERLRV